MHVIRYITSTIVFKEDNTWHGISNIKTLSHILVIIPTNFIVVLTDTMYVDYFEMLDK